MFKAEILATQRRQSDQYHFLNKKGFTFEIARLNMFYFSLDILHLKTAAGGGGRGGGNTPQKVFFKTESLTG